MTRNPQRLWYQFSLRTLLLVVSLLALPLSWVGMKARQAAGRTKAVAEIERLGGTVSYDYEFDEESGDYYVTTPAPPGPKWVRRLLGDNVFAGVRFVSLRAEDEDTTAGDSHLLWLRRLPELRELSLGGTHVTDAGLKHLEKLDNLEWLYLSNTGITDAGLVHLTCLSNLEVLNLSGTQVADAGLAHLQSMPRLRVLYLDRTRVTDAGLMHLRELGSLEHLGYAGTHVTDAGVHNLFTLEKLLSVDLTNTHVTQEGARRLQDALPQCEILR